MENNRRLTVLVVGGWSAGSGGADAAAAAEDEDEDEEEGSIGPGIYSPTPTRC